MQQQRQQCRVRALRPGFSLVSFLKCSLLLHRPFSSSPFLGLHAATATAVSCPCSSPWLLSCKFFKVLFTFAPDRFLRHRFLGLHAATATAVSCPCSSWLLSCKFFKVLFTFAPTVFFVTVSGFACSNSDSSASL